MAATKDEHLVNHVYDGIEVGDSDVLTRTISEEDIHLFAAVSGDRNPAHLDPAFAADDIYGHVVAHGMWTAAMVSAVLGTRLPGPGTVYLGQELHFVHPVAPGDTITARVEVTEKLPGQQLRFKTTCVNQDGREVLSGTALVKAPARKVSWPAVPMPRLALIRPGIFETYVEHARGLPGMRAGIVHPCSRAALLAAVELREDAMIEPLLIGPEAKIRTVAEEAGVSLDGFAIEPVEHSHAAAARGVELAASGRVAMLVKGSLHTDELLGAVLARDGGLRTDRRLSHVYAMDVPAYPKPLIVTDAAVNIQPTLDHKRDICQNAVDLLRLLGVAEPKVAVLAAVETVNAAMPATLDAAALTVMAARGQITGALVDGPLAFDNAISPEAAATKGICSPVAGQADVLLVPDLEAGNMVAKQLIYFAGATAAGLVLGARVPIVLTSRSDPLTARIASVALAKITAARRSGAPR
ncbi:bifunctional enoyl-CoA hydratase/phosphate acetyltransferase [Pontibaca methylaminivorans]|uniref:bifunctional enoyl-CoA hydratase/phosphate acetyltransferase n=1 Tax=Pontibaca methylaminivorans TaxID=515897 RepID=UPI002FD9D51A